MTARICVDAGVAIQLPQQRLLDGVAADAVLGERAAAEAGDFDTELEDRRLACLDVLVTPRQHVGVHVAVRDVSPCRHVEAAAREAGAVDVHHLAEALEGHDHVGRGLGDACVDVALGATDASVDAGRHGLANAEQLLGPLAIARQRQFGVVEHAVPIEHAAEARQRRVGRILVEGGADLLVRLLLREQRQLELDQQQESRRCRPGDLVLAVGSILREDLQRPGVHVFDRRDVDPGRVARPPRLARRAAQLRHQCEGTRFIGDRDQGVAETGTRGLQSQHGRGDDPQRALGPDEQVHEVHARRGVVARRPLDHVRHHVGRHGHDTRTRRSVDDERPGVVEDVIAATDVDDVATRKHDGQAVDPLSRGAVLEGRRPGRIGGDDAADGGAEIGWHWREIEAVSGEVLEQCRQHDARADLHLAVDGRLDRGQPRRRQDDGAVGVAPPVSDDCAPTARTGRPSASTAATSASVRGRATASAWPPG